MQTSFIWYNLLRPATRVSFMQIYNCRIFRLLPHFWHISTKCAYGIFFLQKLAFSTAILMLFVFLLPISIRFLYLDHLVANRMAPSMCPDPCGMRWGSWFQAILYHISTTYLMFMGSVYFSLKCWIELACLGSSSSKLVMFACTACDRLIAQLHRPYCAYCVAVARVCLSVCLSVTQRTVASRWTTIWRRTLTARWKWSINHVVRGWSGHASLEPRQRPDRFSSSWTRTSRPTSTGCLHYWVCMLCHYVCLSLSVCLSVRYTH